MGRIKRLLDRLDSLFEYFGLACLAAVVLMVIWQIASRELRSVTPTWSEESSRILLIWIGFLGIALGVRERAHISITILVSRLPKWAQAAVQMFVYAVVFLFGLYLVIQGAQFTAHTRVATLPATGLPRSVLYVIMPIAGAMVCIYTVLQVLGVRTEKHRSSEQEQKIE
ncbi:MAG: TRAP transporter small permease subunit [Streptosporangiales bacterium]|nr:TRAP transporter small permease subunit [Streptosporangiales bacterium]